MKTLINVAMAVTLGMGFSAAGMAQTGGHDAHHAAPSRLAAPGDAWSEGTVRKVDKEANKITIKHGELKNLGMPPMTMVFLVKDPALLDRVKDGDKLTFVAEQVGGKLTLTRIQSIN